MSDLIGVLLLGIAGGLLSGLFGVGGGIVFVPSLVVFLGEDQHVAQGVSVTVIVATALVGSFFNERNGNVVHRVVGWTAPAAVAAGFAGAFVAGLLATEDLQRLFGGIGILIALHLGFSGSRARRRSG